MIEARPLPNPPLCAGEGSLFLDFKIHKIYNPYIVINPIFMSYHSLEDLVRLAQKTNSKLIVHDPLEGNDVVVLSVDEFEKMVDSGIPEQSWRPDVREMSEGELLDQINRDIATWRSNQVQEEWEDDVDEELEENEEGGNGWNSIGEIIGNKYSDKSNGNIVEKKEETAFAKDTTEEEEVKTIPLSTEESEPTKDEPLVGDDPVFYEEPV